jgi:hypothetical protein
MRGFLWGWGRVDVAFLFFFTWPRQKEGASRQKSNIVKNSTSEEKKIFTPSSSGIHNVENVSFERRNYCLCHWGGGGVVTGEIGQKKRTKKETVQ